MTGPLGARPPTDWRHVERYTLITPPRENLPVVMATMWLDSMDDPVQGERDRRWRICQSPTWMNAPTRGWHAYCLEPKGGNDVWWPWHNQPRGSCTGHSAARAAELMFRVRFDPEAWYDRNQQVDEWEDTPPQEGSSARAAFDVWRTEGPRPVRGAGKGQPDPKRRIRSNRWATSEADIFATLGYGDDEEEVPILQSWGRTWPHRVWVAREVLAWHLARNGEAGVPLR